MLDEPSESGAERRTFDRLEVTWAVDCEADDTFLYASITNISEMGIFVRTIDPLPVGTVVRLRFTPHVAGDTTAFCLYDEPAAASETFVLEGTVQWVNSVRPLCDNPNPGMGVRFASLTPTERERIVATIRTIAYVRDAPPN